MSSKLQQLEEEYKMIEKPAQIKSPSISDRAITNFTAGVITLSGIKSPDSSMSQGINLELTPDKMIKPRPSVIKLLPDAPSKIQGQILPINKPNGVYYFSMVDGKMMWTQMGASSWTTIKGNNNNFNKTEKCRLLQVDDKILILNGVNDLSYIDIKSPTYEISRFEEISNPDSAPTATNQGLSGTDYTIYYGYTYNGVIGETAISPILSYKISKARDTWDPTTNSIILKVPNPPTGAKSWNVYIALAASGGNPVPEDMLMLANNLDINNKSFTDNGTLAIDISRGNPPNENSTRGPKCRQGITYNGRPILYDNPDDPYTIWLGGDGEYPLDFSTSHGGYKTIIGKGTAYKPVAIRGFRTGQGIPTLTILCSSTYGDGKRFQLGPKTITYGNTSFVVWAAEEQNSGAAGTSSPDGVVAYNDNLYYPSPDGFDTTGTLPQVQNILSTHKISNTIRPSFHRILNSQHTNIVGAAWGDRVYWAVPANQSLNNNQIWVYDTLTDGGWYFYNVKADWLFTVAEKNGQTYIVVVDGSRVYRLSDRQATADDTGDGAQAFVTSGIGSSLAFNDQRNRYYYVIQAVFTILNPRGKMKVGASYTNEDNIVKNITKELDFTANELRNIGTGWSDPVNQWTIHDGWSAVFDVDAVVTVSVDNEEDYNTDPFPAFTGNNLNNLQEYRFEVPIEDICRTIQWTISSNDPNTDYNLSSVVYEGVDLNTKIDLQ